MNPKQIETYFNELHRPHIWEHIQQQAELIELAKSPLFLSMMVLACQGRRITNQADLFNAYIEEQFHKRLDEFEQRGHKKYPNGEPPYSQRDTRHYLKLLAAKLIESSETEFFIEKVQFHWVSNSSTKSKLKFIQLAFLFFISLGYIWLLVKVELLKSYSVSPLEIVLAVFLIVFILFFVPFAETFDFTKEIMLTRKLQWSWKKALHNFMRPLLYGFASGALIGLVSGLASQLELGGIGGGVLGFSLGCLIARVFFYRYFKAFTGILEFVLLHLLELTSLSIKEEFSISSGFPLAALNLVEKCIKLVLKPVVWIFNYISIFIFGVVFALAGSWGGAQNTSFINNLKEGAINGALLGLTIGFMCICITGWEEGKEVEPSSLGGAEKS